MTIIMAQSSSSGINRPTIRSHKTLTRAILSRCHKDTTTRVSRCIILKITILKIRVIIQCKINTPILRRVCTVVRRQVLHNSTTKEATTHLLNPSTSSNNQAPSIPNSNHSTICRTTLALWEEVPNSTVVHPSPTTSNPSSNTLSKTTSHINTILNKNTPFTTTSTSMARALTACIGSPRTA